MSTLAELATAAQDVSDAMDLVHTTRDAVFAKNDDVAAVLTTEQAACDVANAAFNAAIVTARSATGWTAANAAFESAQVAYSAARLTFETTLAALDPLE